MKDGEGGSQAYETERILEDLCRRWKGRVSCDDGAGKQQEEGW